MQQDIAQPAPPENISSSSLQLHGVLVRVLGTGVLLLGESGIGKSECALDLITRGHKLVADDVVQVLTATGTLIGKAPELTFGLLEIRGLGVIDVRGAFGDEAVCEESSIEFCVELQKSADVERIGDVLYEHDIAGRSVPKFVLPVSPGRNLAILVETAARIFINRDNGTDAAQILVAKQRALLDSVQRL